MQKSENIRPGQSGAIARTLIQFSLPLILSGILQQLYNWADAFIVGNVEGELALAAIGATGTVVNFYLMTITGFALGLSIVFAQVFGSGQTEFIPRVLSTFSLLLGSIFLILAAVGIGTSGSLLRLMHTTRDTVALAESYLRIILSGIPFLAVYNVYSAALRGIGDSRAPFLAIVFSSVVNVVLDILLVALLRCGVGGAAAATVLSQAAMTAFLVVYSVKKQPLLRFRFSRKALDREALVQGVRLGVPPMIQSSVSAFGSLLLQNFMNGFGTQTVAAITTAYRVDTIILLPIINLGSGISTIVAQNHGAGEAQRTRSILSVGTGLMTIVSLGMTALVIPREDI
ncbi:MATE family efflux transporter [Dysosmobacter acutus]|uniref:MATE family efflux transporter n=1 Tax=Dysosmobacter acutus TaxID=2841504 RepID=UPI0030B9FBC4